MCDSLGRGSRILWISKDQVVTIGFPIQNELSNKVIHDSIQWTNQQPILLLILEDGLFHRMSSLIIPRTGSSKKMKKFVFHPCFETENAIFRISPGVSLRCKGGKHIPIKQHNKPYQYQVWSEAGSIISPLNSIRGSSPHQHLAYSVCHRLSFPALLHQLHWSGSTAFTG